MNHEFYNLGDLLQFRRDRCSDIVEIDHVTLTKRNCSTQQLESWSQSLAAHFKDLGYGPQDRIAIISNNCLEYIISYFAILKLGAVVVPISSKLSLWQINHILKDSNVKLILTDEEVDTELEKINFAYILDKTITFRNFNSYRPKENDVAVVLHTSGSTGNPHRVLITHCARIKMLNNNISGQSNKSTMLFANPFYHSMGLNNLDLNLYNKNNLIFLKKFDATAYLKTIDQFKPTSLSGVPTMFALLMSQKELIDQLDLASVLHVILSGGPTNQHLFDLLTKRFQNATIRIGYGSTETGPNIFKPHSFLPTPSGSVGCERPDILYRLVDDVLQIKSSAMMKGYDNKEQSFTDDGYYITNDRFEVDQDGFYYFVGRNDDMFKSGGNKIYPSEIETVVEQHPAVAKCAVIPVEDSVKDFKPYAFVVLKSDATIDSLDLVKFLSDRLARYQQPRQIWTLNQMPLSSVNKIDKTELKILAKKNLNI
jgi:long-chain acyl-CoA synthetase